jgi:myo-inositol-1(or 4)-monophosphatase
MNLQPDLDHATALARDAAKLVLEHFGRVKRLTKTHAATTDEAVTEADRASQRVIVAGLRSRFPNDGIVGEESDTGTSITFECPDPNGRVWVIDPIDGTNNFIAGYEGFAVCIGLLDKGMPVLGVVLDVCRNYVYRAAKGLGAWRDDRRLSVATTTPDDGSLLMLTSNLITKEGRCPGWAANYISQTEWKVRILGSAALEAVHVASGVAHGAITINGKLWDAAAPAAIVLEAGGLFTDLAGKPVYPFDLNKYVGAKVPFLASSPAAHPRLLEEIRANP